MKIAVVTGASSGIGLAMSKRLLDLGYEVIGVSRSITDTTLVHPNFTPMPADLSCERETLSIAQRLAQKEIFILINCAGFGRFAPHEELSAQTITQMTFLNLTAPMLLTSQLLRSLKNNSGYLININSIEALRASKFAALYSATKAGLRAFGESLFEETRKSELSVVNINPDMTESNFFNELRFETSQAENEKLFAEDIADALEHILKVRKGAVVSDYTMRSLHFGIKKKG
jgi:uncharacterized protein